MIVLKILGGLAAFILFFLLVPVTYSLRFEKWKATLKIGFFFGLWRKEKGVAFHEGEEEKGETAASFDKVEEGEESEQEPPIESETIETGAMEEISAGEEIPAEGNPTGSAGPEQASGEPESSQEVSLWGQIRFALGNGLAEELLSAVNRLLSHSFPRQYHVEGALGLGDPMDTGMLCGLAYALLPGAALSIQWDYIEKVCTLKGNIRGRIIPLYVLYIALRLAASKPAREFWHFRQGGNDNG
ncbi:hypothetical protein [Dialister sp.]|jgi:hypothetical protein|uniref:hypothetical protein n=1 Tax=Dialister sp. TaxID=1955814 RepID=UPI003A5BA644